jgi:hypothetical protein
VPAAFPGEPTSEEGAHELAQAGVAEIADRFGIASGLEDVRWCVRGGRAWFHTLDAWPLTSWAEGGWRPISVGIRGIDFDSRGRARPTNDFLRWLGPRLGGRVVDLDREALAGLLRRETLPTALDDRGPIALRHAGDVVGRGAVTGDGLKSEVPNARAGDLLRIVHWADQSD